MLTTDRFNAANDQAFDVLQSTSVGAHANDLSAHVDCEVSRVLPVRSHLFVQGDQKSHVYIVESGAICIYRVLPDGNRQVLDFALPGDLVGLTAAPVHENNAQASTLTRVRPIAFKTLQRVARSSPELGYQLYETLSQDLESARTLLVTVGQCSAVQKVASFLLALASRVQHDGEDHVEFNLPMTRSDIGDYLGLSIETVSRTFTKLKTNGLIRLRAGNMVEVLDIEALKDICYEE